VKSMNKAVPYQIIKILGEGGEGTVYLARDSATGNKIVLKKFHEPIPFSVAHGLLYYADHVTTTNNSCGLEKISLHQNGEQISALQYPYSPLYEVHWRLNIISERLAKAVLGTYCHIQCYLMSEHKLGITDTPVFHFMIGKDGQFHLVDYGIHIMFVDNPWGLERGIFGYAFAMLLLSIYHINIKLDMELRPGYSYDKPCVYCSHKKLDDVAAHHKWVKALLTEVRDSNASIFLDPKFYCRLSQHFPKRAQFPWLIIGEQQLLSQVQKIREIYRPIK